MKREVVRINKPGVYDFVVQFNVLGHAREWVGIVDARNPGEYELRVTADHTAAGTSGRITVRGVAGPGSVVKVYGMIKIRKVAQQTDDFLELRVLTLDKTARAVAEPMLEIEANDVKASHAASVGLVDKEQILYLMSRGLSEGRAQEEIVQGWLSV